MGADSIYMLVKSTDKATIKKEYQKRVDSDVYEHGHSPYSGTFATLDGLEIEDKTFYSQQDALNYVLDHTDKWQNALAVTVQEDNKEPYTLIGGWGAT